MSNWDQHTSVVANASNGAAVEGWCACSVCTGSDGGRPSSLLLLPEEGDGEPGPADGPQSPEDEEAGEGDPTAG